LRDIPEQRDWEEWDYELADITSSYWANFMKTGNPNGKGLPEWLPSKSGALAYIDLGDEIVLDTEIDKLDELTIEYTKRVFSID
jgi:para-nitrobenzyl esterase